MPDGANKSAFASVEEAVEEIRARADGCGRRRRGPRERRRPHAGRRVRHPEAINFMARFGRGLICLALTEERADYLRLAP